MVYAYGLSEVLIARGGIPLTGRAHAAKLGHLTSKMDESIKNTIAVLSSASFVKMYRTLIRQYTHPRADMHCPMEDAIKSARNAVGSDHHHMCIELADLDPRAAWSTYSKHAAI
ncbi:hypothetical protein N7501_010066 [Penicillium viridicatum]|nr:hypothetical protein N7501_010066 [Penicillium viridicatum]